MMGDKWTVDPLVRELEAQAERDRRTIARLRWRLQYREGADGPRDALYDRQRLFEVREADDEWTPADEQHYRAGLARQMRTRRDRLSAGRRMHSWEDIAGPKGRLP